MVTTRTNSQTFAIGLSLDEMDLLLSAIASDNTPLAKLTRHRLWDARVKLLRKLFPQTPMFDVHAQELHVIVD